MVVPLLVRDRVVGTLDMQSSQAGALNKENLQAFQALAGQLAIAVENATLLAETESARRTVEAQSRRLLRSGWQDYLNAMEHSERIGFAYDLEKLVPVTEPIQPSSDDTSLVVPIEISNQPVGLFKFENTSGWSRADAALAQAVARQLSQQIENLRLLYQADRYRSEAEQALARLTRQGWEKEIAIHPQAELGYTYDLNTVSATPDTPLAAGEPRITHPLEVFGEKIGELSAASVTASNADTTELLEKVGEQLSARVENLRLFYETQRSEVEVEKRARQLAAVATISTFSSQELDVDRMLESVVHLAQRQFGLYHAHIYLYDEKTGSLKLAACGWKDAETPITSHGNASIILSDQASPVARAARTHQPVILDDVRLETGFQADPLLPRVISEMAVPLLTGEQLLGVLAVQADQPGAFNQEDANIQTTLASQVAISLQNARSFIQAQKQAERETLLNVIGQKIREATSVEAVLQIAARELGHALGAPLTIAQLGLKDRQ
jgi:GAF domain-containing protein